MALSARTPAADAAPASVRSVAFNLPNTLTWLRLALAVAMFVLLSWDMHIPALIAFLAAAFTDFLDGYLARKLNLVTTLGRIIDPFADKILVCGAFIFLAAEPGSRVLPWMAVVVTGRELLVTALRSFLEQQGEDFSAALLGKLKMVLQCLAVPLSLVLLSLGEQAPALLYWGTAASVWGAVALTMLSGAAYVRSALLLVK